MKKALPWVIGIIIVMGGLLYWSASFQSNAQLQFVNESDVACLPNGHQQIAVHIHPILSITVDGMAETIPANIGITRNCMAEVHTHDSSGTLHIETADASRLSELSFSHFFDMWEQPIEREGYQLTIKVDGVEVDSVDNVPLRDQAKIELIYTSESQESA
ncbi:MAG: hypothetical protein ACJKTH_02555 [Patescibacteria group bacterium UBA2163]